MRGVNCPIQGLYWSSEHPYFNNTVTYLLYSCRLVESLGYTGVDVVLLLSMGRYVVGCAGVSDVFG